MRKLKPCPFCGSKAVFDEVTDEDSADFGGHFIRCTRCLGSLGLKFANKEDPQPHLVEMWNRRIFALANPDAVAATLRNELPYYLTPSECRAIAGKLVAAIASTKDAGVAGLPAKPRSGEATPNSSALTSPEGRSQGGEVDERWNVIIDFLMGAGPLDGVWFGEKHPTEKGAFWWRRYLRAAINDTTPPSPKEG